MFMKNPDNALGEFAIRELAMCALPEEMDTIFAASGPWLKSLSVYHRIEKQFQGMKATAVGQKFTDFSGKTIDGAASSLSDFVGKGQYTLVDFWASWCGPCRMVSPIIDEIANERTDVKVGKVNVDEQPELAAKFGVMSIPTLIVMKDGKVVNQTAGARPKPQILSLIP